MLEKIDAILSAQNISYGGDEIRKKLREAGFVVVPADSIDQMRAALAYGIGSALNEMALRGLPLEWSPRGGIGVMLTALGFTETKMAPALQEFLNSEAQKAS